MRRKKRVTIRDVAARAGVSATAVSFAFNSPEQLNHNTCIRIREIAAEMNYQPHPVARTLATGRTETIGLVLPVSLHFALHDAFFQMFISEFGRLCDENRMRILLLPLWDESSILALDSIAADGFLIIGVGQEHPISTIIEHSSRPVLLLDSESTLRAPSFVLDNHRGAYDAAKHLLDKGHRQLAVSAMQYTEGNLKAKPFEERIRGYIQAVDDYGLGRNALQIVYTEEHEQLMDDNRPFEDIWSLPQRPTGVLCVSDVRAIKIMRTARERGVSVPDDLALVGFDNIPDASATIPGLTTVDQDIRGRCHRSFELLHALIDEPSETKLDNSIYTDSVKLIVRGSS